MFDWFKKKDSNVIPFPGRDNDMTEPPQVPYVKPHRNENPLIHYSIGVTSDNRISIAIGSSGAILYMNTTAARGFIEMIESAIIRVEE